VRRLESKEVVPNGPGNTCFRKDAPEGAAAAMAEWAGANKEEKKKPRRRSWTKAARAVVEEARERLEARRWDGAEPRVLVGLYAVLHESVYGVEPTEVLGDAFPGACSAAGKLTREVGDVARVVEFLRWTWSRERRREKARAPGEGFRIGWRLQFCARSLLTDWKVDVVRSARPNPTAGGAKR